MIARRHRLAACALAVAQLMAPSAHAEESVRQVVQQFSDSLLDVMKQARPLGFKGREAKIRPAVGAAYDMPAMTRACLGPSAGKLSAEQLGQLTEAFTRYTVANYAAQFDGYDGERFEVGEPRPSTEGAVVVPSRIVPRDGAPSQIDYLMRQDQGGWHIVDVLLDGTVSQVAVRRSEFVSIYRRDGLPGLIDQLDRKTAALGEQ